MTLQELHKNFLVASSPEQVFGMEVEIISAKYKYFAKIVHPDHNPKNKELADKTFKLLNHWKEKAEERKRLKLYGKYNTATPTSKPVNNLVIGHYEVNQKLFSGDLSQIFLATDQRNGDSVLLKIASVHNNNDLLKNEADNLKSILDLGLKTNVHLQKLVMSFEIKDSKGVQKRVNVFPLTKNVYYSLEEVKKKYPHGVPPKTVAWMFNRMMGALFAAHAAGIVHGAIVPSNFIVCPETHNGKLIDWSYSAKAGSKLKAIVPKYKEFYPAEVFNKTSSFATDIYMAAKCIKWIADNNLPREINGFLNYCMIANVKGRPDDVGKLFDEFGEVLGKLYGKPQFIEFKM